MEADQNMFNALKYTQELEKAGFTREQAEASLKLLIEVMNENFATKSDLLEIRSDLKQSELGLKSDIAQLRSDIKEVEYRLTIKLGAMMTLAIGVTATLVRMLRGIH